MHFNKFKLTKLTKELLDECAEKLQEINNKPELLAEIQILINEIEKNYELFKLIHKEYQKHSGNLNKMEIPEDLKKEIMALKKNNKKTLTSKPFWKFRLLKIRSSLFIMKEQLEKLSSKDIVCIRVIGDAKIVDNFPEAKLQVFFTKHPTLELLEELLKIGYAFSSTNHCWERIRTYYGKYRTEEILKEFLR